MPRPTPPVGVAAITENILKRKWSSIILRHIAAGLFDPDGIARLESGLSAKVLSERLRTMHRYGLVARFPRPAPSNIVEYRATTLGKRVLEILHMIELLEQQVTTGEKLSGPTTNPFGQTNTAQTPFILSAENNEVKKPAMMATELLSTSRLK